MLPSVVARGLSQSDHAGWRRDASMQGAVAEQLCGGRDVCVDVVGEQAIWRRGLHEAAHAPSALQ